MTGWIINPERKMMSVSVEFKPHPEEGETDAVEQTETTCEC